MNKKILIIGGGIAGLSAGIYSRLNGFDTEIIEMHSITGGQCTAWTRKGYRFDYCLHWLVGTRLGPFNDIWKETAVLDETVGVIDHEIHSRIIDSEGKEFIIYTNLDKWEEYLCNLAPEDTAKIRKMCSEMKKSSVLQPFVDPPGLRSPFSLLAILFRMMPLFLLIIKYGGKDCSQYFSKLDFKNKTLRNFLDNLYGSRNFSALAFIMMFAWFNQKNAGYLLGGSLPLAQRMTTRFKNLGGILTTNSKVKKVVVEENTAVGVILSDGKRINADYVISAADGYSTIFKMLEGKYLSGKISYAYNNWELFTSMVQVSFGIRKKIDSHSTVNIYQITDQLIGRTKTIYGYSILNYCFDPSMAPEGKSVLIMRFDSPWELWKDIGADEYKLEKQKIEEDAKVILNKYFPGIIDDIEVCDVATPLTNVKYTGVWKGAYEGFLPSSKNMMKYINPELPGLRRFYMAGQWLFPGGGIPPSAQSGKWAIQYICKKERKKFNTGKAG